VPQQYNRNAPPEYFSEIPRGGPATPRGQEYLGPTEQEGRSRAIKEYIAKQLMQRGIDPNTPLDPAQAAPQPQPPQGSQPPQGPNIGGPTGIGGMSPPAQEPAMERIAAQPQDYMGNTGQRPSDNGAPMGGEADLPSRPPVQLRQEPAAAPPPGIWEMLKQYLGQQQQMNQPMQQPGGSHMNMETIEQRYPPARLPMGPEV
jgi:hypothetical protein